MKNVYDRGAAAAVRSERNKSKAERRAKKNSMEPTFISFDRKEFNDDDLG